jgi:hypothetical protein
LQRRTEKKKLENQIDGITIMEPRINSMTLCNIISTNRFNEPARMTIVDMGEHGMVVSPPCHYHLE